MIVTVKERPILFKGEMVKAILDGRKTQTRRVVKPQPDTGEGIYEPAMAPGVGKQINKWAIRVDGKLKEIKCPFGKVGDRLWVRETFVLEDTQDYHGEQEMPDEGVPIQRHEESSVCDSYWLIPHYRATEPDAQIQCYDQSEENWDRHGTKWTPSIYMPRWASRITLEITDIRVERLRVISEEDARAEGAVYTHTAEHKLGDWVTGYEYRRGFENLWNSINSKTFPWESNPWVWVIKFNKVEA